MITDKNKSEIIDQYFKGELDNTTKLAFLKKYEEEEDFREEVDQFKIMRDTFSRLSSESEKRIEEYLTSKNKTKTLRLSDYRRPLSIAASIAVFVTIGIYLAVNNTPSQLAEVKKIPVYQPDNMGFTDDNGIATDSIILFVDTKKRLDGYYQFSDTLTLYFESETILKENIYLKVVEGNNVLTIGKNHYSIKRGLEKPQKLMIYQE